MKFRWGSFCLWGPLSPWCLSQEVWLVQSRGAQPTATQGTVVLCLATLASLSVSAHLPLSGVPLPFLLMSWPFLSPSDGPSVPCPELIHKPRPDRLYWILDAVAGLTLFVPSLTLLSHISNCSVKADSAPFHWFCPPRPPCISPFPWCFPDPLAWLLSFPCELLWQFV